MGTAAQHGQDWGAQAREWAELQEPSFAPVFDAILDVAAVGRGTRVLDVGCGSGLFGHLAEKRGAQVAGIDAAEGMIAVARERTPSADFRVGEMEELPFADDSFDVVTGFNSFQFAADPVHALREARRVTKPGGRVVMLVWGSAEECEAAAFVRAVGSVLPPPPPGAPGPFALSEPGALERLLSAAGWTPQTREKIDGPFVYSDEDKTLRAIAASGVGVKAIRHAGRHAYEAAVRPAIAPFRRPDGTYRMDNKFVYVLARK
jgi:SAM-dependent methyltransferase